jgi:hypothetical protein
MLEIMCFLSQAMVWGGGGAGVGRAVVALHSLHSSEQSRRRCQGDTSARGEYVSGVRGSGSDVKAGATLNRTSERNNRIIMQS